MVWEEEASRDEELFAGLSEPSISSNIGLTSLLRTSMSASMTCTPLFGSGATACMHVRSSIPNRNPNRRR
jgi:hypothetical protein